ncbi:MAG: Na/Pi cotransporter family protein [Oscillospiraceae bacterium]|nr:Na/Pi cotransporter family protein [Oscillospiraceae bacterium]
MALADLILFIGGIGLFLYGMKLMSDGLELSAGSKLKRILEILTKNKFIGVLVGFFVTAIIQSSTATVVMIVGFVNAGLMNLSQAVGVIIGANIGTTTTGLIIALNLHTIAPICIFIGALLILFSKKKKIKHIGMIIAGFGILFLGMRLMADSMRPLSYLPWVGDLLDFTENPWIGIAVGFVITALIQSSTAAMGILLAAMMSGVITDLDQAIFILYGQNLGTTLTVILSSIGSNKITKKAALIHLVYKTIGIGIVVIITLLPLGFVEFIRSLSDTPSTQLVFAHIIINIIMAAILLPFSSGIVKITEMIIKGEDKEKRDLDFKYIDKRLLEKPSLAVVQSYKEVERYAKLAFENYILAKNLVLEVDDEAAPSTEEHEVENPLYTKMRIIYENENNINNLGGKINQYLTKLTSADLEYTDVKLVASLYRLVINIERMGNHAVNIMKAYEDLKEGGQVFSEEALEELNAMFENVQKALEQAIKIFESGQYNLKRISAVSDLEEEVDLQNEEYKTNYLERVNKGTCSPSSGVAFIKILTSLERIADYACNIANSVRR